MSSPYVDEVSSRHAIQSVPCIQKRSLSSLYKSPSPRTPCSSVCYYHLPQLSLTTKNSQTSDPLAVRQVRYCSSQIVLRYISSVPHRNQPVDSSWFSGSRALRNRPAQRVSHHLDCRLNRRRWMRALPRCLLEMRRGVVSRCIGSQEKVERRWTGG